MKEKQKQFPVVLYDRELEPLRRRAETLKIPIAAQIRAAIRDYNERHPLPPPEKQADVDAVFGH